MINATIPTGQRITPTPKIAITRITIIKSLI